MITTPEDQQLYQRLLKDGSQWGLTFAYAVQDAPRGLADAFIVGQDFLGGEKACLILGDNIFFGHGLPEVLRDAASLASGAVVFAYPVRDPQRYGVVAFGPDGRAVSLEEKPQQPKSNFAVPGVYFYDEHVSAYAAELQPSARGEIEITDLNRRYMQEGNLQVKVLGRGVAWLDAGTHESLLQAALFVQAVEERQGMMISCVEEIAYRLGFINQQQLIECSAEMAGNEYGQYLLRLANGQ